MNLHQPIPVLESFKRSKFGGFIRKMENSNYGYYPSFILVLPWVLIGLISPLYVHGMMLGVALGICTLLMLVTLILILSVIESSRGEFARTQLTKEELNKARELIAKHGK